MTNWREKVTKEEQHIRGENHKMIGFAEAKDMTPKVYEGKIEEWRDWKDSVEDYVDAMKVGMKELLKEAKEGNIPNQQGVEWTRGR